MINEDYCSFQLSKLLKNKGFKEECITYYDNDGFVWRTEYCDYSDRLIYRPSLALAMKWLREKHKIIVVIEPASYDAVKEKISKYKFSIWQNDNCDECTRKYDTYEETAAAGINYSLENLL